MFDWLKNIFTEPALQCTICGQIIEADEFRKHRETCNIKKGE